MGTREFRFICIFQMSTTTNSYGGLYHHGIPYSSELRQRILVDLQTQMNEYGKYPHGLLTQLCDKYRVSIGFMYKMADGLRNCYSFEPDSVEFDNLLNGSRKK